MTQTLHYALRMSNGNAPFCRTDKRGTKKSKQYRITVFKNRVTCGRCVSVARIVR